MNGERKCDDRPGAVMKCTGRLDETGTAADFRDCMDYVSG